MKEMRFGSQTAKFIKSTKISWAIIDKAYHMKDEYLKYT